jgi:hypothetical protein
LKNEATESFNPFPMGQWIAWLGATVAAAATIVAFAYSNFQTKDEARIYEGNSTQRLDRIETKVDRVLEIERARRR